MKYSLDRYRIDKFSREDIVEELKRVAKIYSFRRFSGREFDKESRLCKKTAVLNNFNSWEDALAATGIDLQPHRNTRSDLIPEHELFAELERVWQLLGHRPSKTEWESIKPKYSYTTYKSRFHGWVNACAAFIEFKSDENEAISAKSQSGEKSKFSVKTAPIPREEKRNIPMGLRFEVLKRDKFRCVFCGRSPATDAGVVLHIDHITAFSEGGKTTKENLQSLCRVCNLGKGKTSI
jgi:hypothetical protein